MNDFNSREIARYLDLIYIRFKRGARHELTGCSRASGLVHMRPDVLVRDLRSRTGVRSCVLKSITEQAACKCLVREMRSMGQSGASMRSIQRHRLCVRSSELANMHYKLVSN